MFPIREKKLFDLTVEEIKSDLYRNSLYSVNCDYMHVLILSETKGEK
jgi:hypothetical protein